MGGGKKLYNKQTTQTAVEISENLLNFQPSLCLCLFFSHTRTNTHPLPNFNQEINKSSLRKQILLHCYYGQHSVEYAKKILVVPFMHLYYKLMLKNKKHSLNPLYPAWWVEGKVIACQQAVTDFDYTLV